MTDMELGDLEYAGCGYYRRKDASVKKPSPIIHGPEMLSKAMELEQLAEQLQNLIEHCYVHSGYTDCGYEHMTTEEKELYDKVIGRTQ